MNIRKTAKSSLVGLMALQVLFVSTPQSVSQTSTESNALLPKVLASKFFRDQAVAHQIVLERQTEPAISEFSLISGKGFVSTESFAYRILSAIRQLGYTPPLDGDPQPGRALLKKFQRLNGLPVSDVITKELVVLLDQRIKESEARDWQLGPAFPLYPRLTDRVPLNEPSREHFARFLDTVFKALPGHLVPYTLDNFHNFYRQQLPYFVGKVQREDVSPGAICDINYYPEFSNDCLFRANSVITLNSGEFEVAGILLHEYAHWLDANLFPKLSSTARGSIDTLGFYSISYDTAAGTAHSDFRIYYPLRRDKSVIAREFASAYARGHEALLAGVPKYTPFEDFAESFGLYVQGGRVFRHLAERDQYLRQKYDWLRKHVFDHVEYDTGNIVSIEMLRARPTASSNNAFNVNDFGRIDPDHRFQYEFPRLKQSAHAK